MEYKDGENSIIERVKYFGNLLGVGIMFLIGILLISLVGSGEWEAIYAGFSESTKQYLEIGGLILIFLAVYKEYIPREKTGLYLWACGIPFFTVAHYAWGLSNPGMWYFYYFITIFFIYAIITIFDNIKKKFIEYIATKIKEDDKKKSVEVLIKDTYIPHIEFAVAELFQKYKDMYGQGFYAIGKNSYITETNLVFELTVLCNHISGRKLSAIMGFESHHTDRARVVIEEFLLSKFKNLRLDVKWLDETYYDHPSGGVSISNYYFNKSMAYGKVEKAFHSKEIDKNNFDAQLVRIFFSTEVLTPDLLCVMAEMYHLSTKYSNEILLLYKKYELV